MLELDASLGEVHDVASQPVGTARADLVEHAGVDHGRFGEDTFAASGRRREVCQVSIEEDAEESFGDPAEDCFAAEDVEG